MTNWTGSTTGLLDTEKVKKCSLHLPYYIRQRTGLNLCFPPLCSCPVFSQARVLFCFSNSVRRSFLILTQEGNTLQLLLPTHVRKQSLPRLLRPTEYPAMSGWESLDRHYAQGGAQETTITILKILPRNNAFGLQIPKPLLRHAEKQGGLGRTF